MLTPPRYKNNLATGIFYFSQGLKLLWRPELRLYIIVPLVVNCALFFVLTGALVHYYGGFIDGLMEQLPSWLAPLAWIAWIVIGILVLLIYGYSFNMITNIIAAPFYGMLAAKAEELLTGDAPPDESIIKMVFRTIGREISKLLYFLSRGIVIALLMLLVVTIPVVNFIAPFIGLAWGAWSMSIQYSDYCADNNQVAFKPLRGCLWDSKFSSLGFGGFIMMCSITPIVNIIAMPVAVVGGTLYWLHELRACDERRCSV